MKCKQTHLNISKKHDSHTLGEILSPRHLASNGEGNLGGWGLHDKRSKPATGEESPFPKPWYPNKP